MYFCHDDARAAAAPQHWNLACWTFPIRSLSSSRTMEQVRRCLANKRQSAFKKSMHKPRVRKYVGKKNATVFLHRKVYIYVYTYILQKRPGLPVRPRNWLFYENDESLLCFWMFRWPRKRLQLLSQSLFIVGQCLRRNWKRIDV